MDFSLQQISMVELATLFPQPDMSQSQFSFAEKALAPRYVLSRSVAMSEAGKALFWSMPYLIKDQNNCVIGTCCFNSEPIGGMVDISCHVSPDYQNLGVAQDAVKQLLEKAFTYANYAGYELNAIRALIPKQNLASKKVAEKVGFVCLAAAHYQAEMAVEEWRYQQH